MEEMMAKNSRNDFVHLARASKLSLSLSLVFVSFPNDDILQGLDFSRSFVRSFVG